MDEESHDRREILEIFIFIWFMKHLCRVCMEAVFHAAAVIVKMFKCAENCTLGFASAVNAPKEKCFLARQL